MSYAREDGARASYGAPELGVSGGWRYECWAVNIAAAATRCHDGA